MTKEESKKILLTKDQTDQMIYQVTKSVARSLAEQSLIYAEANLNSLHSALSEQNLSEELVLLKILKERIEEHNSKLKTVRSKLDNINYTSSWRNSALLNNKKINHKRIEKLVKENQGKDSYEIWKLYRETI